MPETTQLEAPATRRATATTLANPAAAAPAAPSLLDDATTVAGGANAPVVLGDPDGVWVVESGAADIFVAPIRHGQVAGTRRFLWSVEAGDAVLGVDPAGHADGLGLVAVGTSGTVFRRLSLAAALARLDAAPGLAEELVGLLEDAVTRLSQAEMTERRPQVTVLHAAGETRQLEDGQVHGTTDSVLWVSQRVGASRFAGEEGLEMGPDDAPLPLASGLWLECSEAGEASAVDTLTCLEEGSLGPGLALLRARFLELAGRIVEREREQERHRLQVKAEAEERMRTAGFADLTSVLDTGETPLLATAAGASPLMAACRIVGAAADIDFREPPRWETTRKARDPLAAICRASRVRLRRVALRDEWWKGDAGAMLAFLEAEEKGGANRPVALVPRKRGGYCMVDPETGQETAVTAAASERLHPFAFSFFRPFPAVPLGGRGLVRFVLEDIKSDLALVALMALGGGLLGLVLPLATGRMFSTVIPGARTDQVVVLFGALVAVNLGAALFDLTRAFGLIRLEGRSSSLLQAGVIDRLLALPVPFFRRFTVGDLTQRALGINRMREQLSGAALTSILSGVFSMTNLGLLFYFSPKLALVALGILAGVVALTVGFSVPALRAERQRADLDGHIAGLVFQMIGGIAKLRVAASEGRGFSVWARQFAGSRRLVKRARSYQNLVTVLNDVVPVLSMLVLFAAMGWMMETDGATLDTGMFIAFSTAFGIFFQSGVTLSNTAVNLLNLKPVMERARPILEAVPEVDVGKPDPGELTGRIEGCHLDFRYVEDGPLILQDLSFVAEPGEFVAFVGPSGSGKSTTLRLLLGFEEPENGAIYYDGQDLAAVDVTAVRSQIGVVLQSSRILAGDIFTNIVGSAPLSADDAWEAAEMAGLADDIRAMPMQMQTVISEGGGTISGGQRQRLLIARALVRKPRIIFFDEATSALDNRTQQQVSESLERMNATRLVIAHRLSTIRNADRIHVLEGGRLIQVGSFDELAAQKGLFQELIRRQMA